jgi:hypothetical protein
MGFAERLSVLNRTEPTFCVCHPEAVEDVKIAGIGRDE